jgi:hypothetical protein
MGEMVPFPLSLTRRVARAGDPGETGRILLFTGVRYERHERDEPQSPSPAFQREASAKRRKVRRQA